jgi:hypothetical protein
VAGGQIQRQHLLLLPSWLHLLLPLPGGCPSALVPGCLPAAFHLLLLLLLDQPQPPLQQLLLP